MKSKITKHSCSFVLASDLVPDEWASWFWASISEGAPFCWGGNNRSLVVASDFLEHCRNRLAAADDEFEVEKSDVDLFLTTLVELGDTYVDLEN